MMRIRYYNCDFSFCNHGHAHEHGREHEHKQEYENGHDHDHEQDHDYETTHVAIFIQIVKYMFAFRRTK